MAAKTDWVSNLLDHLLRRQGMASALIPTSLRIEGKGRKGQLVIRGDRPSEDVSRYFRWSGSELTQEDNGRGCGQIIDLHQDTLLDIALGELEVRTAMAAGLVRVQGERSLYNREEIVKLIERLGGWLQTELQAAGKTRGR